MDGIRLRPATDADYAFMRALYGAARADEMQHFPFGLEQKEAFLDQQFAAQTAHYAQHYPTARFDIVERDGVPIGRLYVDVWPEEIRIVDIALMPEARNGGLGTALMTQVLEEGRAAGKPVSIHVEAFNPALHLYRRLGFREAGTNGVYYLMRWTADQVNTAS
jgi:ribosomal protein S18 acetylase RimI-like enzyme